MKNKMLAWFGILSVIAVLLFALRSIPKAPILATESQSRIEKTLQNYFFSNSNEDWWLIETPPPSKEAALFIRVAFTNVQTALKRTEKISPEIDEVVTNFNTFFTSLFDNGFSRVTEEMNPNVGTFKGTEICFFSKKEYVRANFQNLLFYRDDWKAVMIAAVHWPSNLLSAVLIHELGHALDDQKSASTAQKSLGDEVELHELEARVLDNLTGKRYFPAVDKILRNHRKVRTAVELAGKISSDDLRRLDESIGAADSGYTIHGTTCALHLITLGSRFIDGKKGEKYEKVEFYHWVGSLKPH